MSIVHRTQASVHVLHPQQRIAKATVTALLLRVKRVMIPCLIFVVLQEVSHVQVHVYGAISIL